MSLDEKKPKITDYLAGALIAFASVYFWIILTSGTANLLLRLVSYLVYTFGEFIASYLIGRRAERAQLSVSIKSAIISWGFTWFSFLAITKGSNLEFFLTILVCYLIGGVAGAYLAVKERLSKPLTEKGKTQLYEE